MQLIVQIKWISFIILKILCTLSKVTTCSYFTQPLHFLPAVNLFSFMLLFGTMKLFSYPLRLDLISLGLMLPAINGGNSSV